MIAIVDYGMGNIHSVRKALIPFGEKVIVVDKPGLIAKCDKLVLPGVGAFSDAMRQLRKRKLISAIKKHIRAGKI